jgi:hypothetical protein
MQLATHAAAVSADAAPEEGRSTGQSLRQFGRLAELQ